LYIRIFLGFKQQKYKKQKIKDKKQETRSKKHIVDEPSGFKRMNRQSEAVPKSRRASR